MILITFSGLDGAGKSTHVALTRAFLEQRGLRTRTLVAMRFSLAHTVDRIRQHRKLRSPVRPSDNPNGTNERKRIRGYPRGRSFDTDRRTLTNRLYRTMVYPLDCLALTLYLAYLTLCGYDAVVCDRYVYDKMVTLPSPAGRLARLVARLVPRPDRAFMLQVDPPEAARRRPEHHPDYFETKAADYALLANADSQILAIESNNVADTQERIERLIALYCLAHDPSKQWAANVTP